MRFEVIIDDGLIENGRLKSLINDFEDGQWRYERFINYLFDKIIYTCLSKKEIEACTDEHHSLRTKAIKNLRKFVENKSEENGDIDIDEKEGGEIGEILLYGIMKDYYNAISVVPKIFYKQNRNDYAKGSDSVHIVVDNENNQFSYWLGESKFYNSMDKNRFGKIVNSVLNMLATDHIRKENSILTSVNEINDVKEISQELKDRIKKSLSDDNSIDNIKKSLNVPILFLHQCEITKGTTKLEQTYREDIIRQHQEIADNFFKKLCKEKDTIHGFNSIKFHFILFPVPDKMQILEKFHNITQAYAS